MEDKVTRILVRARRVNLTSAVQRAGGNERVRVRARDEETEKRRRREKEGKKRR